MSALISSSLLESTSLTKRAGTTPRGKEEQTGFDLLLKGGPGRKPGGSSEGEDRSARAIAASDVSGTAEDASPETVEPQRGKSASPLGRLSFERTLLTARNDQEQATANETKDAMSADFEITGKKKSNAPVAKEKTAGRRDGGEEQLGGGFDAELGAEGKPAEAIQPGRDTPTVLPPQTSSRAESVLSDQTAGWTANGEAEFRGKPSFEQLLNGYGSRLGSVTADMRSFRLQSQTAPGAAVPASEGKVTANSPQLFPTSDMADVSITPHRIAASVEPAKGISARADLVSMRTDFQPAGMDANGAKAAVGANPLAAQRLETAVRTGAASADLHANPTGFEATGNAKTGEAKAADSNSSLPASRPTMPGAAAETIPADTGRDMKSGAAADKSIAATNEPPLRERGAETVRHPAASDRIPIDKTARAEVSGVKVEKTIDANADFGRQVGSIIAENLPQTGNRQGPAPQTASVPQAAYEGSSERVRYQAGGAAMKTLQIQLQPAHFGTLDVLMKVVNGQMTLDLSVSEPETLMRLQDDREGLKAAMASAGFDLDEAQVTITLRDSGAQPTRTAGSGFDPSSQGRTDGNAANGDTGQSRGQDSERGNRSNGRQSSQEHAGPNQGHGLERGRRSGSDLYL
ncbi:possible flagellar hook length determination protein [Fulvimarina pelagi HTCC2506]|uniref:Possible flagellar hook length determination protein n=1 Tax=Fulvimarina pelagi HTCC2506 TaxID=314231 RepID=Q0G3Q3_9HYPH|nr:flagellar hook-length control protein FliK [Fulvimarina pelagi]EAU41778.1 possible flagellar hook length determination protein [Fulvimarina pelagi HTCC2506]